MTAKSGGRIWARNVNCSNGAGCMDLGGGGRPIAPLWNPVAPFGQPQRIWERESSLILSLPAVDRSGNAQSFSISDQAVSLSGWPGGHHLSVLCSTSTQLRTKLKWTTLSFTPWDFFFPLITSPRLAFELGQGSGSICCCLFSPLLPRLGPNFISITKELEPGNTELRAIVLTMSPRERPDLIALSMSCSEPHANKQFPAKNEKPRFQSFQVKHYCF